MEEGFEAAGQGENGSREKGCQDGSCGCFFCLKVFSPGEIVQWSDKEGKAALCPYCGNETVLWGRPGMPITEDFLKAMKDYWVQ